MKRIFDQKPLYWQRVHEECACHGTNGFVYRDNLQDIGHYMEDQNLTGNCNRVMISCIVFRQLSWQPVVVSAKYEYYDRILKHFL